MKNKGFTLVELLGVIIILGLLMIVVFPNIINLIRNSTIKLNSATESVIISAAKDYVNDNMNNFRRNNNDPNTYCIGIEADLINNGYINEDIFNDKINIAKTYKVRVRYIGNDFDYDIVDFCTPSS